MGMKREECHKILFCISGKEIAVYPGDSPDQPIVYLNTFDGEGEQVYQMLQNMVCRGFTLVTISGLAWHKDMTPWEIHPVSKNTPLCTGGAEDYLQLLTEEIFPKAEELVQGPVLWRGLAGYSLAGLFALYASCRTPVFSRIASMSGSLWFPGFQEYVSVHETAGEITHVYLSLGDKECRTGNPYMKTVQERTEEIAALYAQKGINTIYQMNPGNHFKNSVRRTAAGIAWILNR